MKNTEYIRQTIEKYLGDTGKNPIDLGKLIGVNRSTVCRWIDGTAKIIRNSHWKKLKDLIPALDNAVPSIHLSVDEALLLKSYRQFSDPEKENALKEFTVKAAVKEAHKVG